MRSLWISQLWILAAVFYGQISGRPLAMNLNADGNQSLTGEESTGGGLSLSVWAPGTLWLNIKPQTIGIPEETVQPGKTSGKKETINFNAESTGGRILIILRFAISDISVDSDETN
ncbi:hypothetical protein GDO81_020627 [Engystomops pustulosus]|uniref:Uncharacterized protein n=1 Tax=Engystomops pustulosus TaxID=76066 RepID=A0AAV6Z8W1_ENGPU|nr:hypothetical protein GDO81_020627 [Engystomops pustulosus]KAG8545597.1 hypothetical protein GDO81_020627 [Engystomops pustulosus]KAG8545598.1 hypothetical protein GDO81_020627 [Engystomops pustulosus]